MLSEWYFGAELPTWALMVEILVAGAIVIVSGARLAGLADRLAEEYQLGAAWVGVLLLATVTSLPEVVSGVTATWVGQPNMAFAAIYGSCSFNIVLVVLLNLFIGGGSILYGKGRAHTLNSSFGIVLIVMSLMGIMVVGKFADRPGIAQTCEVALMCLIAVTYFLCMRMAYRTEQQTNGLLATNERSDTSTDTGAADGGSKRSPGLIPKLVIVSAFMVASAWWMARTGDVLADHEIELIGRSLGATVVGSLFLAIATSLPEVVTGLSAVRMGNIDMALGNIFGSNMFNILVIPMLKVASWLSGSPLLMSGENFDASQTMIAGLLPILLTGVVVGGLSYRSRAMPGVLRRFGADSALIAAVYVAGMYLLLASP